MGKSDVSRKLVAFVVIATFGSWETVANAAHLPHLVVVVVGALANVWLLDRHGEL